MGFWDFSLALEPHFLLPKTWAYKYTRYGTSIQFKNINLQHLQYFLDNNV